MVFMSRSGPEVPAGCVRPCARTGGAAADEFSHTACNSKVNRKRITKYELALTIPDKPSLDPGGFLRPRLLLAATVMPEDRSSAVRSTAQYRSARGSNAKAIGPGRGRRRVLAGCRLEKGRKARRRGRGGGWSGGA